LTDLALYEGFIKAKNVLSIDALLVEVILREEVKLIFKRNECFKVDCNFIKELVRKGPTFLKPAIFEKKHYIFAGCIQPFFEHINLSKLLDFHLLLPH
jgi:hypothetical protein